MRELIISSGDNVTENTPARGFTRVLLADDHTLFRRGIAELLSSYGGLQIIGEVPNDQEALRLA